MKKMINLITKPNTSLNNKTGSWRTYRPITDYDICVGCSLCAKICPEGCIEMRPRVNSKKKGLIPKTDYDYCKGCGLCARECPVRAIKMAKDY